MLEWIQPLAAKGQQIFFVNIQSRTKFNQLILYKNTQVP